MGMDEESEESDAKARKKKKKLEKLDADAQAESKDVKGKWKRGAKTEDDKMDEEEEQKPMLTGKFKRENNHNPKQEVDLSNKIKQFCTEEYGIFERGVYVRIDIKKIKKKYVDHFNVNYPLVLCTTNIQESNFGFLKVRFSKHIFHPKILKNNDPIIFSMGWRTFQSIPIYCVEDANKRLRMIKYTPKYTSCFAIFWGPLLPINVAMVAIQKFSEDTEHFRICGTGELLEVNQSFEVMKKLKLIGEPMEIFKKTAFVKGLFNSNVNYFLNLFKILA